MTLQEFIETRPQSYGAQNINVLYSSSVDSNDIPQSPFHLQGMTIPLTAGSVNLATTLKEVDTIKFGLPDGTVTAEITGRQKKSTYVYFTFKEVVVNNIPTVDELGVSLHENSEYTFLPFVTLAYNNSDYNPTINNSEGSKTNDKVQTVDRNASQEIPTNIQAILSQSAAFAELQNCSYTKTGLINGRYNGSKATQAGSMPRTYNKQIFSNLVNTNKILGNEPALGFKEFEGSIHASDAGTVAIKAINQSDRELVGIFFNSELSGSHPNKVFPNFPKSGSIAFIEEGNKLIRAVDNKIYSIDTDQVFTTNEVGGITLVE